MRSKYPLPCQRMLVRGRPLLFSFSGNSCEFLQASDTPRVVITGIEEVHGVCIEHPPNIVCQDVERGAEIELQSRYHAGLKEGEMISKHFVECITIRSRCWIRGVY